jgi:hypothetical protein
MPTIVLWSLGLLETSEVLTTGKTTYEFYFKANHETSAYIRFGGNWSANNIYIDNLSLIEITEIKAQVTGSQTTESSILQDASEDTTAEFRISWTLADRTAGGTTPTSGGTDGTEVITNDDHTETLITEDTSDSGLKISTGFIGTVDDLTIEEIIYW